MPIHLIWVKSKLKGRDELTAPGPILGSLQRVGFWKAPAHASGRGQTWFFQRCGLSRTAIMEAQNASPIAQFKPNWLGGGVLNFTDGESFQLVAKGLWRPVWSWLDRQGRKLLEVWPQEMTVDMSGEQTEHDPNAHSKLAALIMFSWHQILETSDAAAAVAATSAAAS